MPIQTINMNDVVSATYNNQQVEKIYLDGTKIWDRLVGFYISRDGYYLNADISTGTVYTSTTPETIWSGQSGQIKAVGTNYYLNVSQTGSSGNYLCLSTSARNWVNSNNILYFTNSESSGLWSQTYYYTIYNSNSNRFEINRKTGGSYQTNSTLTFTPVYRS